MPKLNKGFIGSLRTRKYTFAHAPGRGLHVKISNKGLMEQFIFKDSLKKRSTKNTKGEIKHTRNKLLKPKK